MRSGAQTLVLLGAPLNCALLRALDGEPKPQAELRRSTGWPAQTTLRAQLKRLTRIGALERRRRNRFPGALMYELSPAGRELLGLADLLECWLKRAPGGPLSLGDGAAKATINALAEGWSSGILRALASGPLSLTELDRLIAALSYPSLERRLAAMRLAGLTAARSGNGRGKPHIVTEWLRRGVAPILLAGRWERRHRATEAPPFGRLEFETAILLALPLLRLPAEFSGSCGLSVDSPGVEERRRTGLTVDVDGGTVARAARSTRRPGGWILGRPMAWLEAIVDGDAAYLELGGDCALGRALLDGLNEALFDRLPASDRAAPLDAATPIRDDGSN